MSDNDQDYILQDTFDRMADRVRKMNATEKKFADVEKMFAEAAEAEVAWRAKMTADLLDKQRKNLIGMVKELITKGGPVRTRWASDYVAPEAAPEAVPVVQPATVVARFKAGSSLKERAIDILEDAKENNDGEVYYKATIESLSDSAGLSEADVKATMAEVAKLAPKYKCKINRYQ